MAELNTAMGDPTAGSADDYYYSGFKDGQAEQLKAMRCSSCTHIRVLEGEFYCKLFQFDISNNFKGCVDHEPKGDRE